MKVTLVYPKLGGQINRAFRFLTGSYDPPLGILYLAGFLREKGIEVNLIDLSFTAHWDVYRNELLRVRPDVVGISSMSPFADQASFAASMAKKFLPECKVVLGGPHPTASPMDTLSNENVDFVVIGEGENTLLELIETIDGKKEFSAVNGLVYKENGTIVQNPPRQFIKNLDEVPFPARDLLPTWKKYLSQIPFFPYIQPYTTMLGGRGCPYNCSFCQPMLEKMFGRQIRLRSPEKITDEVEFLIDKYKIKSIFFFDDTFTAVAKWVENVCDEFIRRKIDLVWGVNSRVNTFTHDLALKLKEAGCIYVAFGVESGSPRVLKNILSKDINLSQIKNAFAICRKTGLLSMASLMIGSPGETKEEIYQTISLVKDIKPDIIDVHFTAPTPGSEMYEWVADKLSCQQDRYRPGGVNSPYVSIEDLEELYDRLAVEWRRTTRRGGYYWNAVRRYIKDNLIQGLRLPIKYLFLIILLIAENNIAIHKVLTGLKNFYLRIFSSITIPIAGTKKP